MLVPVLGLNDIACRCRFARKGNVTFVITARIYNRLALPLLPGAIRVAGRLPASVSVRIVIHWRSFELVLLRLATANSQHEGTRCRYAFFEMQFGISRAGNPACASFEIGSRPTACNELCLAMAACVRRQALLPARRPSLSFLGCSV
jgi:hypothetical protein